MREQIIFSSPAKNGLGTRLACGARNNCAGAISQLFHATPHACAWVPRLVVLPEDLKEPPKPPPTATPLYTIARLCLPNTSKSLSEYIDIQAKKRLATY